MEVYPTYATHPDEQMTLAYLMILYGASRLMKKYFVIFVKGAK